MNSLEIKEVYDGRLPEYQVFKNNTHLKTFDTLEEAQKFLEDYNTTPCGEENPCR